MIWTGIAVLLLIAAIVINNIKLRKETKADSERLRATIAAYATPKKAHQ